MHTHTTFIIHLDSEFAPHCRLLSSSITHPTTSTASILMPSRKGPCGRGPMAGCPLVPSSCLFPASGCWAPSWAPALSGGSVCLISHL